MPVTPRQLAREITTLATELLKAGVAIDMNSTSAVPLSGQEHLVTWAGATSALITDPTDIGNPAEYLRILVQRQFTCVLDDGSLLQMSFTFRYDDIVAHRLTYTPCPVLLKPTDVLLPDRTLQETVEEKLDEDFTRWETNQPNELTGVVDLDHLRLRPVLRFDFDPSAQAPDHPGSHLHLFGEESRLAAFGPMSVGHFVRFIFRHAYPLAWRSHQFLREWAISSGARSITREEESELYLECRPSP